MDSHIHDNAEMNYTKAMSAGNKKDEHILINKSRIEGIM